MERQTGPPQLAVSRNEAQVQKKGRSTITVAIRRFHSERVAAALLSSRISRSTFSLPKVCPYRSGHEKKPEAQEFANAPCSDEAGGVEVVVAKTSSYQQGSSQKAQKQLKPAPLFFVAFVLTHAPNYEPNHDSTAEIRRLHSSSPPKEDAR